MNKDMMKFLETLAGKLTAILAFAALTIVLLALVGNRIPKEYQTLVYIIAIGAMMVFTIQVFVQFRAKPSEMQTPGASNSPEEKPKEQKQLEKRKKASSRKDAKMAYLQTIIDKFTPLNLPAIDKDSGDIKARPSLEAIYISLNTTDTLEDENDGGKNKKKGDVFLGREEKQPLSVLGALIQNPRLVLLGDPGTGKSTFVRYLSLNFAEQLYGISAKPLEQWKAKPLLPVVVALGKFAEYLPNDVTKGSVEFMEEYIVSMIKAEGGKAADFAPDALKTFHEQGCLALFDGLDEVANLNLRPIVVKCIESFASKYARNSASRFLTTCRIRSYEDSRWHLTGWKRVELALFTPDQIKKFIENWYDQLAKLDSNRKILFNSKKPKLISAVHPSDSRRLYDIARTPLILTLMAIVHARHELPDSRVRVYEECTKILLDSWQQTRSIYQGEKETRSITEALGAHLGTINLVLNEIAYNARQGYKAVPETKDAGSLITEGSISHVLKDHFGDDEKEKIFLDYCKNANGLLMWSGTITESGTNITRQEYKFPHLTFEEFLAGRYLTKRQSEVIRNLLDEAYERWREPVKFTGELFSLSEDLDRDKMNNLLEALSSGFSASLQKKDWMIVWMAGELLAYYKRGFPNKKSSHEDKILANLQRLVFESPLSPRERADAADVLDGLGYAPADLHTFVPIPNSSSPDFLISKYLVTNEQYARFLKPENFQNQALWCDFEKFDENSASMNETWGEEAWNWLQQALQNKNYEAQDGVLYPRWWNDPRFGVSRKTAPVVGISWYEANAYCKWLMADGKLAEWESLSTFNLKPSTAIIRLPLETEWARAAGGEEDNRFAFGGKELREKITEYANTGESGINRTTPVWMYPQGKSPLEVMDMSGNAWEWQANFYDKDHDVLVLRGGSWYLNGGSARVSARNFDHPFGRDFIIGFRVLALPSG